MLLYCSDAINKTNEEQKYEQKKVGKPMRREVDGITLARTNCCRWCMNNHFSRLFTCRRANLLCATKCVGDIQNDILNPIQHWNVGEFNSVLIDFCFCLDQFDLVRILIYINLFIFSEIPSIFVTFRFSMELMY